MSIYFFANDNQGICALTGIKSIVIPFSKLTTKLRRFMSDETQHEDIWFINTLIELFTEKNIPPEFMEEWDHFQCIAKS